MPIKFASWSVKVLDIHETNNVFQAVGRGKLKERANETRGPQKLHSWTVASGFHLQIHQWNVSYTSCLAPRLYSFKYS